MQSFLELKKDKEKIFKWNVEKVLSILYVLGFVGGFVLIIVQNNETNQSSRIIDDISFSVKKIDSTSFQQMHKLSQSLEETERLIYLSDSMNVSLKSVVEIKDSLTAQTNMLNNQLAKQISIDLKTIEANKPIISLSESDISWSIKDSSTKAITSCIRNYGNRNAYVTKIVGEIILFNKQNLAMYNLEVPKSTYISGLQPTSLFGQEICVTSYGLKNAEQTLKNVGYAAIFVKVYYQDVIDKSEHEVDLYSGWNTDLNIFSNLKDWQLQLAKEWLKRNSKLLQ